MSSWTRSEYLELAGIVISGFIAFGIYLLQKKLTDKQRVDHRLEVEAKAGQKIYDIQYNDHSRKVHLYNTKLISKKYFTQNKRDIRWGYPYHAAELYGSNFDGLDFVTGIEKWDGKKFYKIGVIPYERILGIKPEGDSSFNGMIFYVKPKLFQRDKYSIAYKSYRYYPIMGNSGGNISKPLKYKFLDTVKKVPIKARYYFYYSWKNKLRINK